MNLFERYLTLWVACVSLRASRSAISCPGFSRLSARRKSPGQSAGRRADLADDRADAAQDRLRALGQVKRALARHRRDAVHQLGGKTVLDGVAGLAVHRLSVRPYLPAGQIDSYIAGLILLAAAPCTAMVFVWSNLSEGEPHFTLSQVALNDVIMVFAFAPIVGLCSALPRSPCRGTTLLLSVVL